MSDLELDDFYFDDSFIKEDMKGIDLSGLTGGKYFRSRLLYLTGQLFNQTDDELIRLGRVVELVHNATLTHDDVIDNSHTRRGAPSVPALINNKKSVLLGDYMLARALHELSDFNNPKLTQELTLTLKELVEGEWIQYENTDPYEISYKLYETLAIKKTGSLFRWCFLAPLVAAKKSDDLYKLFAEFGEELGIIFQMTDDVIDFNKESKKSYGLDFRNNNINFVLQFVGVDYPEYHKKFLQTDDLSELSEVEFKSIMDSLEKANTVIQKKLNRCREILGLLKEKLDSENQAPLEEFDMILDLITQRVF
jgi:octaprenyl-diphosphate synthase